MTESIPLKMDVKEKNKDMKKHYQTPSMTVVVLDLQSLLTGGSKVQGVDNNAGLNYAGEGSDINARSRRSSVWGDEEEEGF